MIKYLKIWWLYATVSFQVQMVVRWALLIFLLVKILRFAIFTFFIIILVKKTTVLAGYTLDETILFFLSFNLVDILAQTLFREVYRFRPAIVMGTFDFYLIKPISPLFRSLATFPDFIDLFTLIPLVFAIGYFINRLNITDPIAVILYILLIMVGLSIALAIHILVLSLAVVTTEIDHAVMVYRDVAAMGRMPIDIYMEPLRDFLTFIIPVGIMMAYPTKSLLGLLSPFNIIYAILFAVSFTLISLKVWNWSLKQYSSASS